MTPELRAALAELARADQLLVVLDFDGTISPIVPVPSDARPLPGALDALAALGHAPGTEVHLLSGRARQDLAQVSGAADVAGLIGSHGQESGAQRDLTEQESAALSGLVAEVSGAVSAIPGVRIEYKPAGLAVHVRASGPDDAARATDLVRGIAQRSRSTFSVEGKSVIEVSVRPLDKGSAMRSLVEEAPGARVLFAGDDITDESAMAVLREGDLGIRVGPGQTHARFRVDEPSAMVEVLTDLARMRAAQRPGTTTP
jgi:trehalose 6-phosphate phosphatase